MSRVLIYPVRGMTCRSCEKLVGDVLKDVPGVVETEVSVKLGKAAVRMRDNVADPDLELINKQLAVHGYQIFAPTCDLPGRWSRPLWKRLALAFAAVFAVAVVATFVLKPLRSVLPHVGASASFGAMFLLGVVASVSTCLASTGGFMLAYSSRVSSTKKTLGMHAGRFVTFLVGGALLGSVGGLLPAGSSIWYGALALILGVGFLTVALNLLELAPSLAQLGIALPSSLTTFANKATKRERSWTSFAVGALTFILPCGFTQTAQALALASGSAMMGASLLMAFALGTLPVLLGMTLFATTASLRSHGLKIVIGAMLLLFSVGQIQAGLTVFGISVPIPRLFAPTIAAPVEKENQQVIRMDVTLDGYAPDVFTLKKDVPVRWEINAKELAGCTREVVSKALNIKKPLVQGMNVIDFTPHQAGQIAFSCSMGMVRGTFNVIN